jgi:hypothetical protein
MVFNLNSFITDGISGDKGTDLNKVTLDFVLPGRCNLVVIPEDQNQLSEDKNERKAVKF